MQLSLNKKQKTSSNMMCKRGFSLIVVCFLLWISSYQLVLASDIADRLNNKEMPMLQEEPSNEKEHAQILILHNEVLNEGQKQNLIQITNMLSSMIQCVEFGTLKEYGESLEQYNYIICLNLQNVDTNDIKKIQMVEGKVMILGADFMQDYLVACNQSESIVQKIDHCNGTLQYEFDLTNQFETIVSINGLLEVSSSEYSSGTVVIGKEEYDLVSQIAGVRYLPELDLKKNVCYLAMIKELSIWLWNYNDTPTEYVEYAVLDKVYAFMPAQTLLEQVEVFVEMQIPFVISVMPVYQHYNYPAMQQFCEVLKYAQANGGAVILHVPILNQEVSDWEEFSEIMTDTTVAFSNYGVYPLGIEAPLSWIYNEEALEWLRRYRTVFIYDDEKTIEIPNECHRNLVYDNYHALIMPMIELDDTGINYVRNYASAYYIDSTDNTADDLKKILEYFKNGYIFTKSLWEMTHSVWANNYHLYYQDGTVKINDEVCSLSYESVPYDENYDYERNILKRVTINIQNQSNELIIFVFVVTMLFLGMIIYARIQNRRNLLGEKRKKREGGEDR